MTTNVQRIAELEAIVAEQGRKILVWEEFFRIIARHDIERAEPEPAPYRHLSVVR